MKRNLFAELSEGFDALKQEREGKIVLRKHPIETKPASQLAAKDAVALRERKKLVRADITAFKRILSRKGGAKPRKSDERVL